MNANTREWEKQLLAHSDARFLESRLARPESAVAQALKLPQQASVIVKARQARQNQPTKTTTTLFLIRVHSGSFAVKT
jgi:hypothetical protein